MAGASSRRKRSAHKSRSRRLTVKLARSRWLERMLRGMVTLIILAGIGLITWGLVFDVIYFSAKLSKLIQYAGDGSAVLSSTLDVVQADVLHLIGLDNPSQPGQEVSQIPDTGSIEPTYTSEVPSGAGLVPYQVEVGGPLQKAPPLPTAIPSVISQSTPTPSEPTTTPDSPAVPGWIVIPSINLDAPIIVSHTKMVVVDGKTFQQWEAPNLHAAGWQEGSALLGVPGNTVLNGHHNIDGEVFGHLYQLKPGDEIIVYSGERAFHYSVVQVMKIEERNASLAQREQNARWVLPSTDERLTLVTCWPPTNNTYRLIVVAVPRK